MKTYRVVVEEVKQFVAHVQAEDSIEAEVKALLGDGVVIETKIFPPKVKHAAKRWAPR